MERFAEFHHDEIRDIDDVVDRTDSDRLQAVLEPLRAFLDRDAADDAGGIFGAEILSLDCDELAPILKTFRGGDAGVRERTASAAKRRNVARDSPVREPVGAVRGNLDSIDGVFFNQFIQRSSKRIVLRQDHESAVLIADTELTLAAHHAERLDAAQFAFADDEILAAFGVLEDRSEGCKRNHIAGVAVRCAADNLIDIAVAGIDPADGKMVGIRVFFAAENFCDDNAGGDLSAPGDFFDFESRHCKCVCKFFGSGLEFDIIFQPVQ